MRGSPTCSVRVTNEYFILGNREEEMNDWLFSAVMKIRMPC
jgi:hypothetical protein